MTNESSYQCKSINIEAKVYVCIKYFFIYVNTTVVIYAGCPKKMYTHKVNIPYYNVYTSFLGHTVFSVYIVW
jgi:hypothetical protein